MNRFVPVFIAALFAVLTAIAAPGGAEAAGASAQLAPAAGSFSQQSGLISAGYDDYDDGYEDEDYDSRRHRHGHGHDSHRGHSRCCDGGYKRKRVCHRTRGHCYKRRECVWHYGKEYCRFTRRCEPGHSTCKWVSVRHHDHSCKRRHYDW